MATKRAGAGTKAAAAARGGKVVDHPARRKQAIGDGLANAVTSMGMMGGRRGADFYQFTPMDNQQLQAMYRSDWMAGKAVDIIAEDMTKEWRVWQLEADQTTAIDKEEVRLGIRKKVREAIKYARLFGGGALILSDGKRSERPLNVERIAKGGLKYMVAVPRTMLDASHNVIDWDPASDHYGQPEFYNLRLRNTQKASDNVKIHWTRIIRFVGNPYPEPMTENDPWGDSVLQRVHDSIRDAGIAMQSAAALVEEAKLDVMMMEDLRTHLSAEDGNARLMERMRLFKLGKSTFNLALMGGTETFDSKTVNFGSLDKVLHVFLQVVSGATDIPATRFLAQSPAGMNSTGESDLRNYASLIRSKQEDMEGDMRRLDEMLLMSALGSVPDAWFYEWVSIWTQSPKEAAETNKLNAEADQLYANSGMVPAMALEKAIIARMIESGFYPGLEEAIAKLSEAELDIKRPEPAVPALDPNKDPANFPPKAE